MRKNILSLVLIGLVVISCKTVPITGRKQLSLLPESEMIAMSDTAYTSFLKENNVLPNSDPRAKQVKDVGLRIADAVERYLNENGYKKMVNEFDWQFHTVLDPTVNAWCMPGGRVVFYTGILPICQDDAGIAVVMGHEIAHAVARHGNERMSEAIGLQAAGMTLGVLISEKPQLTQELLMQSYGVAAGLGTLAFSRKHESEADKLGLVFMAMAGYDPREAPKFWQRMSAQGGAKPPEFLSTHPSDQTRIDDLNAYMDEALKYYKPGR